MDADPRLDSTPQGDAAAPDALVAPSLAPAAPRLRAFLEVVACSGYPSQVVIGLLMGLMGVGPAFGSGTLTLRGLSILLALDSLIVVGLVWGFLRASGEQPAAVLLGWRRRTGEAVLGLSLMPVVFVIVLITALAIAKLAPWLKPPENPFGALLSSSRDAVVLAAIGLVAGGVREEIQRAFILHRFEQHLGGAAVGLVCFSLLFGLGHFVQGWAAVITTTLLGAFWGLVYLRRRSVVAPMVSHGTFNLIETLFFTLH